MCQDHEFAQETDISPMSPPSGKVERLSPLVLQVSVPVHVFRCEHGRVSGGIDMKKNDLNFVEILFTFFYQDR